MMGVKRGDCPGCAGARNKDQTIEQQAARIDELETENKKAELLWWDEKGALDDRIAELERHLTISTGKHEKAIEEIVRLEAEVDHWKYVAADFENLYLSALNG